MKKGIFLLSLLLFLSAGLAIAYGVGNLSSAAREGTLMDQTMASIRTTQDMAKMQGLKDDMEIYSGAYRDYRQMAMVGLGGAILLLGASVISFLKSRGR